jgi:hypothetical protein
MYYQLAYFNVLGQIKCIYDKKAVSLSGRSLCCCLFSTAITDPFFCEGTVIGIFCLYILQEKIVTCKMKDHSSVRKYICSSYLEDAYNIEKDWNIHPVLSDCYLWCTVPATRAAGAELSV